MRMVHFATLVLIAIWVAGIYGAAHGYNSALIVPIIGTISYAGYIKKNQP
ncbi:hypothetical protein VVR12_01890 [Rothia sp. LK2588]